MLEEWERMSTAVERAAELPPAEADALLVELLGDDPALLDRARRVLASGVRDDAFLEPPTTRPRSGAAALREGVKVGPFTIREVLGHGGMGSVFLAEQDAPQRTVALKVLSSAMLSPTALARFRYEVQALASLQHRGIAQVYETGIHVIDDGPLLREMPWFAMEYVEGAKTIVEHARRLPMRERLRLFAEVCDAVQHGHQKGVVHRDLKPDNILVNAAGHPKVIDFGVARATDREQLLTTLKTGVGEIVGTLPYMSPEQILGGDAGVDVRSDVYALGVVLYELLVGALPIAVDAKDFVTSARRICEEPPKRPGAVEGRLRGDLEAIMLKALEKDPTRRYASANALAADVRRYLEHRPIEAKAPSAVYQMRMFARRHRAVVGAIAAVVVVSVAAAVISIGYALRSNRAEKTAVEQKNKAVAEQERAQTLFDTLLQRSFAATWDLAPVVHDLTGGKEPVAKLMAAVQADLGVLEQLARGDPRARLLLAETHLRMGDVRGNRFQANLEDWDGARASYRRAIELTNELLEADPGLFRARHVQLIARRKIWEVIPRGRYDRLPAFRPHFEEILADTERLVAAHPDYEPARMELSRLHIRVAECARRAKDQDLDAAERHAREAIRIAEAMSGDRAAAQRLSGKNALAATLFFANRGREAADVYAEVVAALEPGATREGASYGERVRYAQTVSQRADAATLAQDWGVAVRGHETSAEWYEQLIAEDPKERRVFIHLQMALAALVRIAEQRANQDGTREADRRRFLAAALGYTERALAAYDKRAATGGPSPHGSGMARRLKKKAERLRALVESEKPN